MNLQGKAGSACKQMAETAGTEGAIRVAKGDFFIRSGQGEAVFDRIAGALFSVDSQWRLMYLNRSAAALLGLHRTEDKGRVLWQALPNLAATPFGAILRRAMLGETEVNREVALGVPPVWAAVQAVPTPGGLTVFCRVITRGRQVERLPARAETRFSRRAAKANRAFLALDESWDVTYLNPEAAALLRGEVGELLGKDLRAVLPRAGRVLRLLQTAMADRVAVEAEVYHPASRRWLELYIHPAVGGLAVFIRDITGRREADRTGREMTQVVGAALDAVICANQRGVIRRWNPAAESIFGYPASSVIGRLLTDLLTPAAGRRLSAWLEKGRSNEGLRGVKIECQRQDGTAVWVKASLYPLRGIGGGVKGFAVMAAEITAEQRAEERRRRTEAKFTRAFRASPVVQCILSCQDSRVVDVNASWTETMGWTQAEVVGRRVEDLGVLTDPGFHAACREGFARGQACRNRETVFRTRSGEERVGLVSAELTEFGGEECVVCSVVDVTAMRRQEEAAARRERLGLVGQMAAGLGHEIRNPLTTVRGFLQLLEGNPDLVQYGEYFTWMLDEVDKANRLITEYLYLAKNRRVDRQPHLLPAWLAGLEPELAAAATGCRLELWCQPVPVWSFDAGEMRQLALNLVRNAAEAMPGGGVVTVSTGTEGESAYLRVRDTGGGIPAEVLGQLGTPFVTTKPGGTGLGLAMCYSIAARHGAELQAETGPAGTTFTLWLGAGEGGKQ